MQMVNVPGGSFQMGSPDGVGYSDERPVHSVTLTGFRMGKYEVTQAQYLAVTGSSPSYFSGTNLPVETVTWYDAVEFCNKLSVADGFTPVYTITGRNPASGYPITSATVTHDMTKNGYRLPTEAEWEYAARGGNGSPGGYTYSGSDDVGTVAWYSGNAGSTTHTVGTKAANGLGLYDMSGNVWEWSQDRYGSYGSGSQSDPTGASSGARRVGRGGGWGGDAGGCRSAVRGSGGPDYRYEIIGFRVLRRP
jgi:formylglycine-generating enzyme required for sulfatase activity